MEAPSQAPVTASRGHLWYLRRRWMVRARSHPSALLLVVQVAWLLLYPFVEEARMGRAVLGALGALVLVIAVWMVQRTPGRAWISIGLGVPAVGLNAAYLLLDLPAMMPWSAGLEALFYFYAAGCLIAYMLQDQRATTDELFAAGATFTLLAWGFAYLFLLCQALQPGSFGVALDVDAPRRWSELMFLSFALLSSTGIGDVIPVSVHARSLASLEMFVGVMYITLVVSRLIGLVTLRARR